MSLVSNPAEELAWVVDRSGRGVGFSGYNADGWDDSRWVLHAMYEVIDEDAVLETERDLAVEQLERSEDASPQIASVTRTVGGYLSRPGPGWRRVLWRDLERHSGGSLVWLDPHRPPGGGWFDWAHLPETLIAPPEGSLDEVSLNALIAVLAGHSVDREDTTCFAYYAPITLRTWRQFDGRLTSLPDVGRLFEGRLASVLDLVAGDEALSCTPSNIWPRDRSWFVWTGELLGTKVSGSRELITAIDADPDLEPCIWRGQGLLEGWSRFT
jgi:hypothetical protein